MHLMNPCLRCGLPLEPGHACDELVVAALRESSAFRRSARARPKDTNPKTIYGQAKPPLGLVPGAALVHMAEAFRDGADKYGPANWRLDPVSASTYFSAALRHMQQWQDGEDLDPVSKVNHLGHAATNLAILLDAMESGTLIDDRPPPSRTAALIREKTRPLKGDANG